MPLTESEIIWDALMVFPTGLGGLLSCTGLLRTRTQAQAIGEALAPGPEPGVAAGKVRAAPVRFATSERVFCVGLQKTAE